jgi:monoterpene epsilon-lactone hydrolase
VTDTDPLQDALSWQRRLGEANAGAAGIEDVRAINDRFMAERAGELPGDVQVEPVDAGGIPAEWVSIEGAEGGPVVFFCHGGGYMLGAASENRTWAGRLARAVGGRVLGFDYRLAPEHAYPAQQEDACTAYRWLLAQGQDPAEVAFVGESAGGGLVVSTLIALRDAGDPLPAAAVVTSPLVDFTLSSGSLDTNVDTDAFVTREVLTMMMDAFLQGQDAHEASPMFRDLSGLPPLLAQVGTGETSYDDSARLVEAAKHAGVDATLEPWEGMFHLWHGFADLPQAKQATDRIGEFILAHVGSAARAGAQS